MGRPREWPMREIINGIFYVTRSRGRAARGGCYRATCRRGLEARAKGGATYWVIQP
jgi:hypothetical protein